VRKSPSLAKLREELRATLVKSVELGRVQHKYRDRDETLEIRSSPQQSQRRRRASRLRTNRLVLPRELASTIFSPPTNNSSLNSPPAASNPPNCSTPCSVHFTCVSAAAPRRSPSMHNATRKRAVAAALLHFNLFFQFLTVFRKPLDSTSPIDPSSANRLFHDRRSIFPSSANSCSVASAMNFASTSKKSRNDARPSLRPNPSCRRWPFAAAPLADHVRQSLQISVAATITPAHRRCIASHTERAPSPSGAAGPSLRSMPSVYSAL